MTQSNGSRGTKRMVVAAALAAGMWAPAHAQDVEKGPKDAGGAAAKDADLAAETAYLKAYFAERELKDLARAEKEYAAVVETKGASHDVVARALMGRARCLRALDRAADADPLLDRIVKEFADVKDVAAEVAKLRESAARRTAGAGGVESQAFSERVRMALSQGSPNDAIVPFGDRAVPILESIARGDEPSRAGAAADVLLNIDTALARQTIARLAASADLPFPVLFATRIAQRLPARGSVAMIRTMPSAAARRAGNLAVLSYDVDDAAIAAILADDEGRPPFAKLNLAAAGGVRMLLAGLASQDEAVRKEAGDAARALRGPPNWDATAQRAWFGAPAAALADPDVRSFLVENFFARSSSQMQGDLGASPALLRAIASHPLGARAVLMYYTNPQQFSPPSSWDREALRLAIAGTQNAPQGVQPYNNLARVLDAVGMANAEDLGFLAAHWSYSTDFRGLVLQPLTTLRRVDGALAAALLDPSYRPEVLQSCCAWIQSAPETLDVAPEVSRAVARLMAHPANTVRAGAALALRSLAIQKRLDPGIDPIPLVDALATVSEGNANSALFTALRALPQASRARLLPTITAESPRGSSLIALIADLPGEEVDRKLESLVTGSDASDMASAAASALATRLKGGVEPVFERVIRTDPARARGAVLSTVVQTGGSLVPSDVAERLLLLGFEVAPGSLVLSQEELRLWQRLISEFPTESLRRISRAALHSRSEKDRRWGASTLGTLGDEAAWDDLMVVAEDPDPDAREFARNALRAIEDVRTDMEALRSVTEMRKVRGRLAGLLASKETVQRRAGVAAIVALGSREWIGELVRLASEDPASEIQTAACDALVALGAQAPKPAAQVPEKK